MLSNYLSAGTAIVNRLQQSVTALRGVYQDLSMTDVMERLQVAPAAHVIYSGDRTSGEAGQGLARAAIQQWKVILIVRNVSDQLGGSGVIDEAGTLISAIAMALKGWQPSSEHRPLQWSSSEATPPQLPVGVGVYTLTFETTVINA